MKSDKKTKSLRAAKSLDGLPFFQRIILDPELAKMRREYASRPASERLAAAEWSYDEEAANSLLRQNPVFALSGICGERKWPDGMIALAIEPRYAPAILTVGSYEYQMGRPEEAMKHFLTLIELPPETEDLHQIIDEAGDFLLDQEDYERARQLYASAAAQFPQAALFHNALCVSQGKLGRLTEAIEAARRAVACEPDNYKWLNDLGWSLVQGEQFEEGQAVLEKALAMAPPDYEFPKNNLQELKRLKKEHKKKTRL